MDNLPTIRQLQYLIALVETGSFSQAAETCNVTQSTLSAGIAALEDMIGHRLIDRSHRQATLTALGEEALETARRVTGEAGALMARARHLNAPLAGPLRLGIIPTIAPYLLPRLLPELREKLPDMELQLHEDLSARLITALRNGALDMVLMAFPFDMTGIATFPLFSEPFYLAAPKGLLKGVKTVGNDDLQKLDVLLLEEGHCLRDHALAACRLAPPSQRKLFSATSLPTLIQMVQNGYGVTLLPEMAALHERETGALDVIPFKAPAPARLIGLAWRENAPRLQAYKQLSSLMKKLFSSPA